MKVVRLQEVPLEVCPLEVCPLEVTKAEAPANQLWARFIQD